MIHTTQTLMIHTTQTLMIHTTQTLMIHTTQTLMIHTTQTLMIHTTQTLMIHSTQTLMIYSTQTLMIHTTQTLMIHTTQTEPHTEHGQRPHQPTGSYNSIVIQRVPDVVQMPSLWQMRQTVGRQHQRSVPAPPAFDVENVRHPQKEPTMCPTTALHMNRIIPCLHYHHTKIAAAHSTATVKLKLSLMHVSQVTWNFSFSILSLYSDYALQQSLCPLVAKESQATITAITSIRHFPIHGLRSRSAAWHDVLLF